MLIGLNFLLFAAATLAPADTENANPIERDYACPSIIDTDKRGDAGLPSSFLSAPLLDGELYCTVEREPGSGFFSLGDSVLRLHERGNTGGTPYRIDYYRGWAEVFLDARAAPDRRTSMSFGDDKQEYQPDIVCRYNPFGDFPPEHVKHQVSSDVTCALFATDSGSAIFYFSENQNGVMLGDRTITQGEGAITLPDAPEVMKVPRIAATGWFSTAAYPLAFGNQQAMRGERAKFDTPASRHHILIDPSVTKLIRMIMASDNFLIQTKYYNIDKRQTYTKVSSQRLKRAVPVLVKVAGKMGVQ